MYLQRQRQRPLCRRSVPGDGRTAEAAFGSVAIWTCWTATEAGGRFRVRRRRRFAGAPALAAARAMREAISSRPGRWPATAKTHANPSGRRHFGGPVELIGGQWWRAEGSKTTAAAAAGTARAACSRQRSTAPPISSTGPHAAQTGTRYHAITWRLRARPDPFGTSMARRPGAVLARAPPLSTLDRNIMRAKARARPCQCEYTCAVCVCFRRVGDRQRRTIPTFKRNRAHVRVVATRSCRSSVPLRSRLPGWRARRQWSVFFPTSDVEGGRTVLRTAIGRMGGARPGGLFIKCDAERRDPIHYRQMIAGPPSPPPPPRPGRQRRRRRPVGSDEFVTSRFSFCFYFLPFSYARTRITLVPVARLHLVRSLLAPPPTTTHHIVFHDVVTRLNTQTHVRSACVYRWTHHGRGRTRTLRFRRSRTTVMMSPLIYFARIPFYPMVFSFYWITRSRNSTAEIHFTSFSNFIRPGKKIIIFFVVEGYTVKPLCSGQPRGIKKCPLLRKPLRIVDICEMLLNFYYKETL